MKHQLKADGIGVAEDMLVPADLHHQLCVMDTTKDKMMSLALARTWVSRLPYRIGIAGVAMTYMTTET